MKKIIIIGCPGSGKTTFAEKLRDKTGLPLYYLDAIVSCIPCGVLYYLDTIVCCISVHILCIENISRIYSSYFF